MSLHLEDAAALEWRNVSLDLGEFAVRDASLKLRAGTWTCVVGPTGAGKTLLLEIAGGFLRPDHGSVLRAGVDITNSTPEERAIAYAPQDGLLFPHLDVRRNLSFGTEDDESLDRRVHDVAMELGIDHLLNRRTDAISGGEAQRVCLGRALLVGADVLMLDESTSALDEHTREIVGNVLAARSRERRLAVVHVTHDRAEADRLADVIVSMDGGRIVDVSRTSDPGLSSPFSMEAT